MMIVNTLLLLAGLALIIFGADALVDGASAIARKAGISEFVIGLTIVGFGTSCPELVVSITGALGGNADISIGNVLGSNIFNTLLILGITAVILPVAVTVKNRKVDIPLMVAVSLLLPLMFVLGEISLISGIVMLVLFAAYIIFCFKTDENGGAEEPSGNDNSILSRISSHTVGAVILIFAGLVALVAGGRLFVDYACIIARALGASNKFIAVTVLAAGTSLPELATSVVAAAKGKGQLALGNVVGSNIFNVLLILGASAVITPLSMAGMDVVDIAVFTVGALLLPLFAYTGKKDRLDRGEGVIMLVTFAAYYIYLISKI
ncbi:MAG: calcium/sodium antiporter [Bacteroidales bacterium]|nr:calcium/sodium antiporter [Bacteroidales bacterium]